MKIISVTFRGINDHITGKFTRNRHLVILVIRFAISIGGGATLAIGFYKRYVEALKL